MIYSDVTEHTEDSKLNCTLAIIKPEAVILKEEIERMIIDNGFAITRRRWLKLKPADAMSFYKNDSDYDCDVNQLVLYMSSGPIIVFILSKPNAVNEWKKLMGSEKVLKCFIFYCTDLGLLMRF